MGTEQSKNEEKPRPRQQGVSRDEVNRLLEQQRREYERKLQDLNVRPAPATNSNANQSVPVAKETNSRNLDHIIAQQLQDFVQIAYNNSPSTSAAQRPLENNISPVYSPSTSAPGPSTSTTPSIERDRNPYRFTREDLCDVQSPTSPHANANLYPNLNTANANVSTPTVTTTPLQQKGFNNNNRGDGDFVFINSNTKAQGTQPSAPPLPTQKSFAKSFQPKPSPSRSNSSKSNEDKEYNCITCGKKYGLNIFQCHKGHSSCRDCKMRSVPCGICRGPIGDTRNITLEALISEVKLAACVAEAERKTECPNSADGCTLFLKMADIDAHLKECPFNDFPCPLSVIFGQRERCRWRGKLSQMVSHFDCIHPEHRQADVDTEMVLINIIDNNHIVHLVELSPYIFLVHIKVADEERKIYVTVQLLSSQISASKWSFELHIYNKREPRRKIVYSDICHSNTVSLEEIFKESKCAAIPQSYALNYVNEGCLNYKFFIKRDFEYNPSATRGKWRGGGRGRGRGRGARANS